MQSGQSTPSGKVVRTLGLVGGTGWVSTLEYYRLLNEGVARRLGGHEAARCILYSLNFGDVMRAKARDPDQHEVGGIVVEAARRVVGAGAEGLMLCANTMHMFAERVEQAVDVPLLHIATATGARIRAAGMRRVGLLGTRPTMERDFYRARLLDEGIEVVVPGEEDRELVDRAIYHELVMGELRPETRARFVRIMDDLGARGAEGVVLGCTEIPLLVAGEDAPLPLFDTLRIHVDAGVELMLGEG